MFRKGGGTEEFPEGAKLQRELQLEREGKTGSLRKQEGGRASRRHWNFYPGL